MLHNFKRNSILFPSANPNLSRNHTDGPRAYRRDGQHNGQPQESPALPGHLRPLPQANRERHARSGRSAPFGGADGAALRRLQHHGAARAQRAQAPGLGRARAGPRQLCGKSLRGQAFLGTDGPRDADLPQGQPLHQGRGVHRNALHTFGAARILPRRSLFGRQRGARGGSCSAGPSPSRSRASSCIRFPPWETSRRSC